MSTKVKILFKITKSIAFNFLNEHNEFCRNERIPCKFCGSLQKRSLMKEHHLEKCKKFEIPCEFAYIGCTYTDYRNRMDSHINNKRFRKQHVEMIQMLISNSFNKK